MTEYIVQCQMKFQLLSHLSQFSVKLAELPHRLNFLVLKFKYLKVWILPWFQPYGGVWNPTAHVSEAELCACLILLTCSDFFHHNSSSPSFHVFFWVVIKCVYYWHYSLLGCRSPNLHRVFYSANWPQWRVKATALMGPYFRINVYSSQWGETNTCFELCHELNILRFWFKYTELHPRLLSVLVFIFSSENIILSRIVINYSVRMWLWFTSITGYCSWFRIVLARQSRVALNHKRQLN